MTRLSHDADVSFMLQTRAARLGMFLFCASDISTQGTAPVYVIDMSEEQINRDVIRSRHVLLRCTDSSLDHE
jgi:hypothetical protein